MGGGGERDVEAEVQEEEEDNDARFVLDQHAELYFSGAGNSSKVTPLGHIILISSLPVFVLTLSTTSLPEKQ